MSKQPTWIGKKLGGRYLIQELLGQGGMSAVYKAMDQNLNRVVAVKLIHPHLSGDPEFVRRFEEEAKAVAQLRHPNIVQVYDFDHDDDVYYIVFEFVPGETLQNRLKRLHEVGRSMDVELVQTVAADLADALDYAHSRNLIHRDIKPANVMLNVNNKPVLMDFGIVKIVGGTQHTATGAVMGTARYMSPEQIKGERIDERTDLYSLGVMLFEMAGGRAPFEADSAMTVMMMHVNDPVPDLRGLRPDVPPGLVRIINKALAKNRENRFERAAELSAALRSADLDDVDEPAPAGATVLDAPVTKPSTPEPSEEQEPAQEVGRGVTSPPASAGGGTPPPTGPSVPGEGPAPRDRRRVALIGSAAALVVLALVCVGGALLLLNSGLLGGDEETPPVAESNTPDPDEIASGNENGEGTGAGATNTPAPSETPVPATPTPTDTPEPTNTLPPTDTPEPSPTPTPTVPPDIPYSRINDITLEGGSYVVSYETWEFTETLPGMHVHFFFDTVPPEQAGVPGGGPWFVYGGPRPFTGYTPNDRPAAAEEMCILVANPDHSIQLDSGNCYPLPES
jgi:serine/threonine-protein kinase